MTKNLIGTYGQVRNREHIVAEDLERAIHSTMYGAVVRCIDQDGRWLTLWAHKNIVFKTLIEDYILMGTPKFYEGNHVYDPRKKRSGVIHCVCWHFKRKAFYYYVQFPNKLSECWFFDDDLIKED